MSAIVPCAWCGIMLRYHPQESPPDPQLCEACLVSQGHPEAEAKAEAAREARADKKTAREEAAAHKVAAAKAADKKAAKVEAAAARVAGTEATERAATQAEEEANIRDRLPLDTQRFPPIEDRDVPAQPIERHFVPETEERETWPQPGWQDQHGR